MIKNECYRSAFTDSLFSIFAFFEFSLVNIKPLYSQFKGDTNYLPFQKKKKKKKKN